MLGHMLASGADDGTLRAWDLRTFAQGKHLGEFRHHKYAVPPFGLRNSLACFV